MGEGEYMQSYAINNDTRGAVDANGNGCSWYDTNANNREYFTERYQWNNCDNFNTPEFNAQELCAECGGGIQYARVCSNTDDDFDTD